MNQEEIKTTINRRKFLIRVSMGFTGIAAAITVVPVVSAFLAPLLNNQEEKWRDVGALGDFEIGRTMLVRFEDADPQSWNGADARTAAWVRRDTENRFTAFSANCTHMGCPIRWEADAELFMCPCHGGVFYRDGTVASGPPPKRLVQYPIRVTGNQVQIKTSPLPITNITD